MLPSDQWIVREIERAERHAANLRERFREGAPAAELLMHAGVLAALVESLESQLPPDIPVPSGLSRHLAWMDRRLREGTPADCVTDIEDICDRDLPALALAVSEWQRANTYRDPELFDKLAPLIAQHEYDSAVRKAFVILKGRMVTKFGLSKKFDGARLANEVFGGRGVLSKTVDEKERDALVKLVSGLYGEFRNRYGHNDVHATDCETEAVIAMINWLLHRIDSFSPPSSPSDARH